MYYKITNAEENHNNYQYKDGLNIIGKKLNNQHYFSNIDGY